MPAPASAPGIDGDHRLTATTSVFTRSGDDWPGFPTSGPAVAGRVGVTHAGARPCPVTIAPAAPHIAADLGVAAVDIDVAITAHVLTLAVLIRSAGGRPGQARSSTPRLHYLLWTAWP
jgi:hypothetical protein